LGTLNFLGKTHFFPRNLTIWGFPEMGCTPKSSIFTGFSIINHLFWGNPPFMDPPPYSKLYKIDCLTSYTTFGVINLQFRKLYNAIFIINHHIMDTYVYYYYKPSNLDH
jgi:hypothetical protein